MSIVFHGYQIQKSTFWDTIEVIRTYYRSHHPALSLNINKLKECRDYDSLSEIYLLLRNDLKETVQHIYSEIFLHVYDVNEDFFVVEVMESGFSFMNHFKDEKRGVIPFYYDDREPEELEHENEQQSETTLMVLEKEKQKHFFLFPF